MSTMFSSTIIIWCLLFIKVSSTLDTRFFNFEDLGYSNSFYQSIMEVFMASPDTTTLQVIGLISDTLNEYNLPIKRLHEDEKSVIIGQSETVYVHSLFIEITCEKNESEKTIDNILPSFTASYTIVVILRDAQNLYYHEINACMLNVFERFLEEPTVDVVIMFSSNYKMSVKSYSRTFKVLAYVYEPYREETLRNVTGMSFHKIFYDKSANLHLHPLKVLAYGKNTSLIEKLEKSISQPARIDDALINIVGKIYNATIILTYQNEPEEELQKQDLYEHLEQLRNGSIDLWMSICLLYPKIYQGIMHTFPNRRLDVICILPKYRDGHVKYQSIGGGKVLSLLLMLLIPFFISSFLLFLSNKISSQNMPVLKLAKLVLNQSDIFTHKKSSMTIRVLLGTWLAASLVYSTSLQTFITSRIIRSSVEDRMTTVQEVLKSDIRLRIEETYWKITKNHYAKEITKEIVKKVDIVPNDALFDVYGPDIGYLTTKEITQLIKRESSNVYVLRETFLPNLAAYYFSDKSPYMHRFDKAVTDITETGIMQKWVSDNQHRLLNGLKAKLNIKPIKFISYKNLISVIYIYNTGLLLALIIFICEIKFQ